MKTKPVWQIDQNGYLCGQTVADESPLEPGVYLIPRGCVETSPPHPASEGREWKWNGVAWGEVDARPALVGQTAVEKLAEFLRLNPDVRALLDG